MKSKLKHLIIVFLVLIATTLQVHSKALQNEDQELTIIKDEISFLQQDLSYDTIIVQEFLQTTQSPFEDLIERKEELDEKCESRKHSFENLLAKGELKEEKNILTYENSRRIHEKLETEKDNLITQILSQEHEPLLTNSYIEEVLHVSKELEQTSHAISNEIKANNSNSKKNTIYTLGFSLLIGIFSFSTLIPLRKPKVLTKNELHVMNILQKNKEKNCSTTITDIKKQCNITQPTAQTLIGSLERKELIITQRKGREKWIFPKENQ